MSDFQIKQLTLPHDGNIPGAAGLKKVVIPRGTKVWCIVYGTLIYWCAYLDETDAKESLKGLEDNKIELKTLIAFNFKDAIPKRIFRPDRLKTPDKRTARGKELADRLNKETLLKNMPKLYYVEDFGMQRVRVGRTDWPGDAFNLVSVADWVVFKRVYEALSMPLIDLTHDDDNSEWEKLRHG